MKPKPHLTKWALVIAMKIRRFDTQAESGRDRAVERGERAYVIPPGGRLVRGDPDAWRIVFLFEKLRSSSTT
jgi:hypothetical protein